MNKPTIGFRKETIVLPLERILPVRTIKDPDKAVSRYKTILSSIPEVGVIEPLMVHPQKGNTGFYLLMDGHLRLHALRELRIPEVRCLVALEDESFTYNARVSRLNAIQEHAMITKAVNAGVPVQRIAAALHKDVAEIKARLNLLNGISPEAVDLLKDKQVCQTALNLMRKVKPMRQIEFAELMVSANNFSKGYAEALLLGTPKDMLVDPAAPKVKAQISRETLVRLEMEMENLERDYKGIEDTYAENMLNLTMLLGYLRKLLANNRISRFLGSRHGDVLTEFERITAADAI